jgi:16S rRNA processing protein RimM
MKNFVKIGKILDAHALRGEVFAFIFSGDLSWAQKASICRLGPDQDDVSQSVEYELQKITPYKNGCRLRLAGIENRTQSELLKGQFLFVEEELFVSTKGESIFLREILGFRVLRLDGSVIGTISGFSSNGPQDLLIVEVSATKKLDIPFVDAYINEIQWKEQAIVMDLPEGMENLGS